MSLSLSLSLRLRLCLWSVIRTFASKNAACTSLILRTSAGWLKFFTFLEARARCRSHAYGKRGGRWICGSNLGNCSSEGPNPQERKTTIDQKPSHGKLLGANRIKRKMFYLGGIDPKCGNEDISEFSKPVCELLECRLMPSTGRRFGT